MKLNKLFLVGALLAFGLTSCNKDDNGAQVNPEGDTYVSVSMSVPQQNRAGDGDYNSIGTYAGVDKINDMTIYLAGDGKVEVRKLAVADLTVDATPATGATVTTAPFQVKSGVKTVYAVINITPAVETALNAATNAADLKTAYEAAYVAFGEAGSEIAKLESGKDVMLMSGEPVEQTILPNVSAANAPTQNKVAISVKRAAARVSMTITQQPVNGAYEIKALRPGGTEVLIATVSDLNWSVAQYEKKYYLQQKTDALSPAAGYIPTSVNDYNGAAGAMAHYDYSQLANRTPVHQLNAPYAATDVPNVAYKYVSETTHADTDYRKGNTAYILVKGKLTPA
ncbi:Mfa1 family fimbria major subunit, partial [Porphyromonas loveana]|uniref:Mfa1 family fimbria major subunit n=1 Tax=Porphyromonas loveana TaxID=1884669 RepID=UPI0035A0A7C5